MDPSGSTPSLAPQSVGDRARGADSRRIRIEPLPDGRHRVHIEAPEVPQRCTSWCTAYPRELIEAVVAVKGVWVCDEIMRDEDPSYVERRLRLDLLSYVEAGVLDGRRLLDFGCGSGASTLVLARLFPRSEIVGVELQGRLLDLARRRVEHLGRPGVTLLQSPSGMDVPDRAGQFDHVVLSAVFEHLLPAERRVLLPRVWRLLKPGGILFLNQTPHRYSPVEWHTTGLPLINYLPDALALHAARRFSREVDPADDWETMLRKGIRGATVGEILGILRLDGNPQLLRPREGDLIDLWYRTLSGRRAGLKKAIRACLKGLRGATGIELAPELALAIRKRG